MNKSHKIKHKDSLLKAFGDAFTADHVKTLDDGAPTNHLTIGINESGRSCPLALGLLDYYSGYRDMFPCVDKSSKTS